jgi:hypothetical protein
MSRTLASLTSAEVPAFRGTFTFDGDVFESFGWGEIRSTRIPLELIESVELSLDKGLLKTPTLRVYASGGCLGLGQPFEASDAELPVLVALVEEMQAAVARKGGT